jgi:hypothetical protein
MSSISLHGIAFRHSGDYSVTFSWLYSPLGPWPLIFQFHDHFTDGRPP